MKLKKTVIIMFLIFVLSINLVCAQFPEDEEPSLSVSLWFPQISGNMLLPMSSDRFSYRDNLGLTAATTSAVLNFRYPFNEKFFCDFTYFRAENKGRVTVPSLMTIAGLNFGAGSTLFSHSRFEDLDLLLGYKIAEGVNSYFNVFAGFKVFNFGILTSNETSGYSFDEAFVEPFPVIGVGGQFSVNDFWKVKGKLYGMDFSANDLLGGDPTKGSTLDLDLRVSFQANEQWNFDLGYKYAKISGSATNKPHEQLVELSGPFLNVGVNF